MRILVIANDSDGLYFFRKDLLKRFMDDGHQVSVALPDGEWTEKLKQMGCTFYEAPVDRRGVNPVKDMKLFFHYMKLMKTINPDLVITYTIKPNIYGGIASKMNKVPYAVNITGLGTAFQKRGILRKLVQLMYRIGCGDAKVIFTENPGDRNRLVQMGLFPEHSLCVLNGAGVDLKRFAFQDYPKDDGAVRFLFIGRIMREKGIDEFFSAADRLLADNINADFYIAGEYDEDSYKTEIEWRSKRDHFHFYGWLTDICPAIRDCHCFVLPSYHEGMANTLLECGAMGRPLITSAIHGCMEAVRDNVNGYLVPPHDADSLYEVMKYFALLPWERKAQMGRASHDFVASAFDKKQVVEDTVRQLY